MAIHALFEAEGKSFVENFLLLLLVALRLGDKFDEEAEFVAMRAFRRVSAVTTRRRASAKFSFWFVLSSIVPPEVDQFSDVHTLLLSIGGKSVRFIFEALTCSVMNCVCFQHSIE